MKSPVSVFGFTWLLSTAAAANAHGPQIQVTVDGGQLVTRQLLLDGPYSSRLTGPKAVYVMQMREHLGAWYPRPNREIDPVLGGPKFYSGPGIAYGYGYDGLDPQSTGLAPGATLHLGFRSGLKRWTGSEFADAGAVEFEAFRGSFAAPAARATTSDAVPLASLGLPPIDFASEGAEVHSTIRYRLLGDGTSPLAPSPDGVYLASFLLGSSQPGLAPSDPFYFVLTKNGAAPEVAAAVAALGVDPALVQYVPEPASALVAIAGFVWLAAGPVRRRAEAQL